MRRSLILVLALVMMVGCSGTSDSVQGQIEGIWQYDGYTIDGIAEQVEAHVNATRVPWTVIDDETITGNAGCNEYGGPYELVGESLVSDLVKDAAWCGPDDGTLMDAELAFEGVVWREGSVGVSIEGDAMTWSNGAASVEFVAIDSPPTTEPFEPEPQSDVGRLDCSPGVVSESIVTDEGQPPLEIAQDADPEVVTVDPWQPLWYSGLNAEGEVVVEFALGDMPGADYQVWTCDS